MYKEIALDHSVSSKSVNELIIIPGHATFKDSVKEIPSDVSCDNLFVLQPFQVGEPGFYVEHIYAGLELAAEKPDSLLVFSGGFTRKEAKVWSEAATYRAIAESKCDACSSKNCNINQRMFLDEKSYDSRDNLANSINLFSEIVGRKPNKVTVVGWGFKKERFEFFRDELGIPKENFQYIGVNNPNNLDVAMIGETRTLKLFRENPLGSTGELAQKVIERKRRFA